MKKIFILFALIAITVSYQAEANELIHACKGLNRRLVEVSLTKRWAYCNFHRKIKGHEASELIFACERMEKEAVFKPMANGMIQVECKRRK